MATALTRRRLLHGALPMAGLAWLGPACGGGIRRTPNQAYLQLPSSPPGRVGVGRYPDATAAEVCRDVVRRVTDLSWLQQGDTVFLKVACNSGGEHPAVTCPAAVEAMVDLLRSRGAGTIYVGDQSGVADVRLTADGRESSTREMMAENGLLSAVERAGATLHNFDDQGWDGYYQPAMGQARSWEQTPFVPRILDQVDHVVLLPRIGSHVLAGYTCGIKIAVGWLRDDSRLELHQRGQRFFERIAEINLAAPLRDKLRLVLTLGTHGLLNIGPDFGAAHDFDGTLAIAATDLVDHDTVAAALVPWLDRHDASVFDLYSPYPADVDFFNRRFVERIWGATAVERYQAIQAYPLGHHVALDPCISHLAVLTGHRPAHIDLMVTGAGLPEDLDEYLERYSGRPFRLVRSRARR
ncbi:MAG: DUF362 domain-containing protein [Deltaproteobacteria bacterium]|nr:DUF362 domain-containing protein [Deltaproteobacteria bacterium]